MAKENPPAEVVAEPAPALTLDEFCSRLSETVRSPELIGAFHSTEKAAGAAKDTAEAFQARFVSFSNKPV